MSQELVYTKAIDTIKAAGDNWPTTFVARNDITRFTGGVYTPKTMCNEDYKGQGPENMFYIGRQAVYPVDSLCAWLIQRVSVKGY